VVRGPIPPGESQLDLRYPLPAGPQGAHCAARFETDVPIAQVFIADSGLDVSSTRLHRRRPVRTPEERIFLHFEAFHVDAGETLELSLAPLATRRALVPSAVRRSAPTTPREPTGERSGARGPRPREAVRRRAGDRRPQRRGPVHSIAPAGGPGPAQRKRARRKCGEMTYVVIAYGLVGGHLSAYGLHFFRERRSLPGAWQRFRRPIELDKSGAAEVQAISPASSTYGCGFPVPGVMLRLTPLGQVRVPAALSAIPCAHAPVAPNSLAPADRVGSPLPKSGSLAPASPTAGPITGAQGARTFPLHQTVGTLETHGRARSGTGLETLEGAAVGRMASPKAAFRGELEWQRAWRA